MNYLIVVHGIRLETSESVRETVGWSCSKEFASRLQCWNDEKKFCF